MGQGNRRLRKDSPNPRGSRHLGKRREVGCFDDVAIDAEPVDPGQVISSREVITMSTDLVRVFASASHWPGASAEHFPVGELGPFEIEQAHRSLATERRSMRSC